MHILESLSCRTHTDTVRNKISKVVGILYRLKNIFPEYILQTLYNSSIFYCPNYTINDILLSKLHYYGLQNNALRLMKSYLHGRSQYVQIENVKSCSHPVLCGIPQGSVLGPLLFNILINDIPKATSKFKVIMYADDTTLVSHLENFGPLNDINTLEQELNREISKVNTWLLSNELLLNVAKSKFMIFFKHPRTIPKLSISINGNPVEQVTNFNFLGITLDQNITWNDHISKISIKVARVIGIMNKLKHIFPHQILRTLYNSLIHPHLIYGLYIWGFSAKRLTILQKKVVRILARRPYISHTTSIFKDLKILKLKDQYSIQLYKLYHKNTNNLLPSYFNSFTPYYDVEHNHDHILFASSNDQTGIFCAIHQVPISQTD